MTMTSTDPTFECLVDLYDSKYRITLSNVKSLYLSFCRLYQEITKIDTNQDLSFHSNTFEVFDEDDNRFKRITSFGQLIANHSRVRVLLKPQIFRNYLSDGDPNTAFDTINSYESNDYHNKGLDERVETTGDHMSGDILSTQSTDTYVLNNRLNDNKSSFYATNDSHLNDSRRWTQSSMSPPIGPSISGLGVGAAAREVTAADGPSYLSTAGALTAQSQTYCPNVIEYASDKRDYSLGDNHNYMSNVLSNIDSGSEQSVSKGLDITVIQNLIDTQIQTLNKEKVLNELRAEGIEMKQNFNFEIYLCKVCDECFQTADSALTHTRSAEHSANKSGNFTDDLDKQLVIATENLLDIAVVLARKQELRKLDLKTKYQYLRHGIRIKDGVGSDAFVCLVCKVSFQSSNYVRHHMKKFEPFVAEEHEVVYSSTTFKNIINSQAVAKDESKAPQTSQRVSASSNDNQMNGNKRRRNRKRNRNRRRGRSREPRTGDIDRKDTESRPEAVSAGTERRRDRDGEQKDRNVDRRDRETDRRDREKRAAIEERERRERERRERRDRERRERRDVDRDRDREEFTLY